MKPTPMTASKPVNCQDCNRQIPPGSPFYDVNNAPKCEVCCTGDGTKATPQTSSKPETCKKCNQGIPAGTPFYDVDGSPKCKDCCIVSYFAISANLSHYTRNN
ncbi:hypothetical protein COOONC_14897 [Cooperia oncophora]